MLGNQPARRPVEPVPGSSTTLHPGARLVQPKSKAKRKWELVVGLDFQSAQDLIQAEAGVFYSRSLDCSGRGRFQVVDRNWVVVVQSSAPGAPIDEGSANLGVVKKGEPRVC